MPGLLRLGEVFAGLTLARRPCDDLPPNILCIAQPNCALQHRASCSVLQPSLGVSSLDLGRPTRAASFLWWKGSAEIATELPRCLRGGTSGLNEDVDQEPTCEVARAEHSAS